MEIDLVRCPRGIEPIAGPHEVSIGQELPDLRDGKTRTFPNTLCVIESRRAIDATLLWKLLVKSRRAFHVNSP
jgi:hypothetical protein